MSKNNKANRAKKRPTRLRRERGHWRDDRLLVGQSHFLPIHPGLTNITCPDCGAHWEASEHQRRAGKGGALEHAPTCPIAKGYADASDDDRAWFIAHPEATERVRPPTMPEVQAVMLATGQGLPDMPNGGRYEPGGQVVVTKVTGELRRRNFSDAVLFAQPVLSPPADSADEGYDADEYDADGQHIFREHFGRDEWPS